MTPSGCDVQGGPLPGGHGGAAAGRLSRKASALSTNSSTLILIERGIRARLESMGGRLGRVHRSELRTTRLPVARCRQRYLKTSGCYMFFAIVMFSDRG